MTDLLDTDFVPSDPVERKRLKDAIINASGLMQMQKDKADQVKDAITYMHEEWGISKKIARQLVTTFHKDNYPETTTESAMFEVIYETVMELDNT